MGTLSSCYTAWKGVVNNAREKKAAKERILANAIRLVAGTEAVVRSQCLTAWSRFTLAERSAKAITLERVITKRYSIARTRASALRCGLQRDRIQLAQCVAAWHLAASLLAKDVEERRKHVNKNMQARSFIIYV